MTAEHLQVWLFCFDFLELETEARTLHIQDGCCSPSPQWPL